MPKTQSMKRALRKARHRAEKQKSKITKNLLKNNVCDNCVYSKKTEWATYKRDVGQIFCTNQLYHRLYKTNNCPKENTCRLWSGRSYDNCNSMYVNWSSGSNLFIATGQNKTITLPAKAPAGTTINIINQTSGPLTIEHI